MILHDSTMAGLMMLDLTLALVLVDFRMCVVFVYGQLSIYGQILIRP